ncbi:hypothetical protein [Salmonirosea aquatica]|uniref:Uncharacterized protein n=1 Tax=Salmonirosea aquatica TaxID=2654236 RepID=A0A7C9FZD3_9BACT|nr:hypothetical protein [Cytophagaceae bacterium SJW1-29]
MRKISFFFLVVLICGCAKKYSNPVTQQVADSHRIIAIVPPSVNLNTETQENAMRESINFQQRLYSWLLSWKAKNQLSVDILKTRETNDLLEEAGYFDGNDLSPSKICEILVVDAILTSHYSSRHKFSSGESRAIGTILGAVNGTLPTAGPATGKVSSILELYDGNTGEMIWAYEQKKSTYVGATPYHTRTSSEAMEKIMKSASKNMPYFKWKYKEFSF